MRCTCSHTPMCGADHWGNTCHQLSTTVAHTSKQLLSFVVISSRTAGKTHSYFSSSKVMSLFLSSVVSALFNHKCGTFVACLNYHNLLTLFLCYQYILWWPAYGCFLLDFVLCLRQCIKYFWLLLYKRNLSSASAQ